MPLPIGHTAIGLATQAVCGRNRPGLNWWRVLIAVVFLSNLPDLDVVIGLLIYGNGSVLHRGPTHSLMFALVAGFLASNGWRVWQQVPKLGFTNCFLLILSHVVADAVCTGSEISFFWPLTVHWSDGYMGWRDVVNCVVFGGLGDVKIVIGSGLFIFLTRAWKKFRIRREEASRLKIIFRFPHGILIHSMAFLTRRSSKDQRAEG
jgi:membrane-bound metal-dependent hydrolase YbcI (DUF457 family)